MSALVRIGLIELAFGAVLGWAVLVSVAQPATLGRLGVASPRRILQAHLDFIIMGLILVAVGLAAPGIPGWLAVALAIGTWVNPALFLPLAFHEKSAGTAVFKLVSGLSFVAVSGGLVAVAVLA